MKILFSMGIQILILHFVHCLLYILLCINVSNVHSHLQTSMKHKVAFSPFSLYLLLSRLLSPKKFWRLTMHICAFDFALSFLFYCISNTKQICDHFSQLNKFDWRFFFDCLPAQNSNLCSSNIFIFPYRSNEIKCEFNGEEGKKK